MRFALSLCLLLAITGPVAHAIEAEVMDGDTFVLDGQSIRLWGIEAPELRQECLRDGKRWLPGPESAAALKALLTQLTEITCTTRDVDRFGRTVATCRGNGQDIGYALVGGGWAFDFFEYSRGFYVAAEARAQAAQRGVWAGECMTPWRWRRQNR